MTLLSIVLFFGLAAWGWGGLGGLIGHPARAGGLLVIGLAAAASLFSGIHLGGCSRPDAHGRWRLVPLALISLLMACWPAYSDRRDLATIGGDTIRYLGLALLIVGGVMRVGPMFLLGDRFTWPLATQPGHKLLTTGLYRFIRHPSYSGAMVGGVGWVLLFRSGLGLVLVALLIPFLIPMIGAEESLLLSEFGEDYRAYRERTWRLLPFVY
ncbi:methyltransferase family protein [Tundrisphaera lichenicola]|uniref:methyltransferase family protein n=1 Tax=Tundrisphaera lichenicola TaxID=2029860 RepID=UPI003EBEF4A5